jgi:hypothetical protein
MGWVGFMKLIWVGFMKLFVKRFSRSIKNC